ncbi:MAG: class I SAM-dependent methyltransferase [Eubacterium sp.]|nr:class I SAM-dependent methyltransferase [Eubacterium sp.]
MSLINKSKNTDIKINTYKNKISEIKDNQYLISMVPVEEILRLGCELGLDKNSRVLDLCCGYGTVLKVWGEAFGISGTGVDICKDFIHTGKKRLKSSGVESIKLIHKDVTKYEDDTKYDVVICSETIDSIDNTFQLSEKFLKKGGTLLYQKVFSTTEDVPKELDEFDGGVYPLTKLNKTFNDLGYYITHFATGTENDWNRYYTWSVRRDIDKLRKKPNNSEQQERVDYWNYMHFKYRMPYENQALFGLQKL